MGGGGGSGGGGSASGASASASGGTLVPLSSLAFSSYEWRWGVVGGGQCQYFASESDSRAANGFELCHMLGVKPVGAKSAGKAHALEVRLASGKVFLLAFQSSQELGAWGGLLSACAAWARLARERGSSLEVEGRGRAGKARGWGLF